ncbi:flagellar basal body M-ring protein FliF [Ornithinibacillus sp. L9]|uniref:Flagellar M-ring protein n=1 Tax=Ornithinibacillus caprae TaxID=2678566 RepID=A0A6N8FQN4_9BACI|nr:flagellar basal-body MS-ring/collar protein FliF [Ornithinibacillus caprae]MUK89918.1 flagellar basal body M-ring protein FliF [Ornithinibacillus caprae]
MKEKIMKTRESVNAFWSKRSKSQKGIFIGSIVIIIALIAAISLFATNSNYVPLYNNLSLQEVGQIKNELDARGVPYEIQSGGTTVLVPEEQVNSLLVDLAGQGIPNSGNIDYSFFSENSSWGVTDNEFDMMKLDAMQTELSNLIKGIDGIQDAQVMINMPKDPVFASESLQPASASIVLSTQPGYQFQGNQINSLYHLVSRAVPNLTPENIVIMNQYFEYFDQNTQDGSGTQDTYTYQQTVKKDIERDIQRRVQQMLGTMVGMDNVIVSVTADVDFTQENRVEELVEPIDPENMEGLPVSIESIHETYSGLDGVGGLAGLGDDDTIDNYAELDGEGGEYELVKETINNEFNRIRRDIVESPFKVRDLGIQVAVDNVRQRDGDEIEYLTQQDMNVVEQGIGDILNSIITTSIDKEYGNITTDEKISIVFQEFSETTSVPSGTTPAIPVWMYVVGGLLLVVIIILLVMLLRNRNSTEEEIVETEVSAGTQAEVPEINEDESESVIRKKQLEKMAKDKPEDFAKLLRSWIGEE